MFLFFELLKSFNVLFIDDIVEGIVIFLLLFSSVFNLFKIFFFILLPPKFLVKNKKFFID